MKKNFFLLFSCLSFFLVDAQFKQIAEGPKFTEPEEGFAKILQMKNGQTFFLHVTTKNGINIRIYNTAHAEIITTTVTPAYETLKTGNVEAAFEINNDVVVFISERDDRSPILYRLIIDGNTGKLKEEKTIVRMKKEGLFINTSSYNSFDIYKDPYSDNYAVSLYYLLESDIDKRIEIIHYGSDNNEINRAFCVSKDETFKFFLINDIVVFGPEKLCVFLFAAKDKYTSSKGGYYVMATIEKGNPVITYTNLNVSKEMQTYLKTKKFKRANLAVTEENNIYLGIKKYNPVTKQILWLTAAQISDEERVYIPYLFSIDPLTNKCKSLGYFEFDRKLNEAYKERFEKEKDYSGMPQNLFINDDGGFSVVYEEIMVQSQSTSRGEHARTDTKLGKLVINTYNKDAAFVSAYLIPKAHWIIFQGLYPFYHARRENSSQKLYRGNQYKSFAYLNGSNKNYIFFNDSERNNDVKKDKFVEIQGIGDSDAFMYQLSGTDVFPKREYAFGVSEKKGHNLALFSISTYNKANNIFTTLKLDKETIKSKEIKLVWLQPQ